MFKDILLYVMYHTNVIKLYHAFFFISEEDVFARRKEFEKRVSESQTGIFSLD